jgi:hypothetical protein
MRNAPSTPAIVSHVCPTHGPRLQAPPYMSNVCRSGRATEVDVAGWVATARDHYPDEDPIELAEQVGIPAAQAQAALAEL